MAAGFAAVLLAAAVTEGATPVAAQAEPAAAVAVLVSEEVTAYPVSFFAQSQPNTAYDMITRLPGFTFDGGGGGSTRGLSGAVGNVLIDGKGPSSKSDSLQQVLSRIPAGQVVRIDVIRGGAPGIDMQGKSIVANVIRRQGASLTGAASLTQAYVPSVSRAQSTARLEGAGELGVHRFEGALVYGYGDSFDRVETNVTRTNGAGALTNQSQNVPDDRLSREFEVTLATESLVLGGDLRLNGQYSKDLRANSDREQIFLPQVGLRTSRDRNRQEGGEVGGRFTRPLSEKLNGETILLRTWNESTQNGLSNRNGTISGSQRDELTTETISQSTLRYAASSALTIEAAGELAYNTLEGSSASVVGGVLTPVPGANATVEEKRGEVSLIANWRPQPQLTFDGGIRYETSTLTANNAERDLAFAKPSLVVTWVPAPRRQVRLRVERVVGQLNFGSFLASTSLATGVVTAGAGSLTPTQTRRAELSFEQQFWNRGAASLTLTRERLDDVIDRVRIPNRDQNGNITGYFDGSGNIGAGVRDIARANLALPLDRFGIARAVLTLNGTITRSEVTDPTTGDTRRISGEQPYFWSVRFNHDLPDQGITYNMEYSRGGKQKNYRWDTLERNGGGTPFITGAVTYQVRPSTSLRFNIRNVVERKQVNERKAYSGERPGAALNFIERRQEVSGTHIQLTLRQSLS